MAFAGTSFQCSTCKLKFKAKADLTSHLRKNPSCKTLPKTTRNPHAFTGECDEGSKSVKMAAFSKTIPDTFSYTKTKSTDSSSDFIDATLLAAMEKGFKKSVKPSRKSGLETSVLSTIAGDEELSYLYSKLDVDPTTGKRRLTKEIVGLVTRKAKIEEAKVAAMISRAQNVSICFLLDTTGSMSSYISGVKEQIVDIVNRIQESGCGISGLAFVGYKDWCDGKDHFEILPFTKSIEDFKKFVAGVRASGGGDFPEDVIGGLNQAILLSWPERSGSRIIFHLADAPPHGKPLYHNFHSDSYPNGHPSDRSLELLFADIHGKGVSYFFGRINDFCDQMVGVFEKYYGDKIETMDSKNTKTILTSVTSSVMKTVFATCHAARSTSGLTGKKLRKHVIDEIEPDWSLLPRYDGTILSFLLPESIEIITKFAKFEARIKKCRLQIATNPFAKGSVRLAYYGKVFYAAVEDTSSLKPSAREIADDVVFKEMISLPAIAELDRQRYMTDLEVQSVASKLAFDFNDKFSKKSCNPGIKLKFLRAKVVRIASDVGIPLVRFLSYEKRFRGADTKMIKYTNNANFVHDAESLDENGRIRLKLAIAFSHFTHDITDGYLLVCDLQGISTVDDKENPVLLLTDPAIHCSKHLRFGKTNLGSVGIEKFFRKHVCNEYCHALGLEMPIKTAH